MVIQVLGFYVEQARHDDTMHWWVFATIPTSNSHGANSQENVVQKPVIHRPESYVGRTVALIVVVFFPRQIICLKNMCTMYKWNKSKFWQTKNKLIHHKRTRGLSFANEYKSLCTFLTFHMYMRTYFSGSYGKNSMRVSDMPCRNHFIQECLQNGKI